MNGINCDHYGTYRVSDMIRLCNVKDCVMVERTRLEHNLCYECWTWSDSNADEHFLMPIDVIQNMDAIYDDHQQRIREADLTYPIILDEDNVVRDGMHRLSKASIHDIMSLKCVYITREELDAIKI